MNDREVNTIIALIAIILITLVISVFATTTLVIHILDEPKEFKNHTEGSCLRYTGSVVIQCMQMEEIIENQEITIGLLVDIKNSNLDKDSLNHKKEKIDFPIKTDTRYMYDHSIQFFDSKGNGYVIDIPNVLFHKLKDSSFLQYKLTEKEYKEVKIDENLD